ncbi:MAG: glycosyltransferase family 4 protein [Sulfolobales archaeon]|nr:glycosyltransferase family 4 protein [Sulfolobales archaeon]
MALRECKLTMTEFSVLLVSGASLSVYGGRERWIMEVAKLMRYFSPVTVISLAGHHKERLDRLKLIQAQIMKHGVTYHEIKTVKTNLKIIKRIPISFHKLAKIVMQHQKIYVAGDLFFGIFFSLLALFLGKRGLIIGLHVSPSIRRLRYASPILKILNRLHAIKAIHVVNIGDLTRLKCLVGAKVTYIPNFVDCTVFRPVVVKRNDVFNVLFVGALEFNKGIDVFLKVAEQIKKDFPNTRFIIASYGGSWERHVRKYAESGLVEYKGFITDEDLIRLYCESHLLMMPSREEPFGLVAIEAQACGTPVISSNLPSFQLTVKDGLTGLRVKNREVIDEWLKAFKKIYDLWRHDAQAYNSMCNRAREHICKNFYFNVMKNIIKLLLIS